MVRPKARRTLTVLIVSAMLAVLVPTLAESAPEAAPEAGASCPTALTVESTNGTDYVAVFYAPSQVTATFDVTLYAKDKAYTVTTPSLALATPYVNESGVHSFRSTAIDLQKPSDDQLIAAAIVPSVAGSATVCPEDDIFVPSIKSLTDPHRVVSPEQAHLENAFGSEIGMGEHAVALAPAPPSATKFACSTPFVRAGITTESMPQYTQAATEQHASGIVNIFVDLSPTGSVTRATMATFSSNHDLDVAALASAHATVYHPEIFACRPRASHYLFSVNFQNGGVGNDVSPTAVFPQNGNRTHS